MVENTVVDNQAEIISEGVNTAEFKEKPVYDFFKRAFDIVCSLLALIVLSPVFLITIIAIVADDFGNPFFVQERIGKDNKPFRMYKFRSMRLNAEKELAELMKYNE